MAHEGIFATKAEIDVKVGENVDLTGYTEANINLVSKQIEGYLNSLANFNFSAGFDKLDVNKRGILSEAASNLIAVYFISYNMAGYTSRVEAEDMINLLLSRWQELKGVIKDDRFTKFISNVES